MPPVILSSDSHVFEPPDLWQTRIDAPFRDRAPRIQRIDGTDQIVVEADQILSGIGLISNAGARFEAPETISAQGRFEDVHRGGYDPEQHLKDMALDGVSGEVLYPSQGLFYFKVADAALMSAIFRTYNDWLAEFCRADPARLKGIAMINLDDIPDAIRELERSARLGLAGAMITEYPFEDRRYDQAEYEPFWAAAAALDLPLSLHTATRRQGKIRGVGDMTLRDASSRATKAFYPALSMSDLILSGVFERHPRLTVALVEFELAWAPHVLSTMDYTYRERHGEAIYRFKDAMLPSDFFHRNIVLGFQEDAIGIRLRDVIGVDNMMWGSDYPHSESTFPQSKNILAQILARVPDDEQAKIVGGNAAREAPGGPAEGFYSMSPASYRYPDDPRPAARAFATKFKQTFGIDPNYLGEAGYTAASFSVAALEKAGRDLTLDSFIAGMESMKDWHDVFEGPPLSLSSTNHHASNQSFLSVVKDTRWVPVLQEPLSF